MNVEERDPTQAALNAVERIRRITATTRKLAETPSATALLDAVHEQVEDELELIERVITRLGRCA